MMSKTILVPIDGSKNASKALDWAISLAKMAGMKLLAVNVQPSFHTVHAKALFNHEDIEQYQQQLFNEVTEPARATLQQSDAQHEVKLLIGDAKNCIVQEITDRQNSNSPVAMIVMGSRGTNPLFSGLLGSVSYAVIHSAICPVTIIPHD
ncbi:universal stress protein [Advenella kashmirensis]|nr:universal stress protein [Advenella kashmirensis]